MAGTAMLLGAKPLRELFVSNNVKAWPLALVLLLAGCGRVPAKTARVPGSTLTPLQAKLVEGARDELTWGTGYSGEYFKIAYPNGDPPRNTGACTDVVIRAYRYAGYDLQKLIHEDISKNWSAYPRYAGLRKPDTNIDHRRVPNQQVFFRRFGTALTKSCSDPKQWQAGDIVTWKIVGNHDHTGICTDKLDEDGFPYVIHNIGGGPAEEDVLRTPSWTITGHFRYPAPKSKPR